MTERELYPYVTNWLNAGFTDLRRPAHGTFERKVFDASTLDWRQGQWMRPDLVMVAVVKRPFEATPSLLAIGFEIKAEALALQHVHQALAHTRMLDQAYLVGPAHPDPGAEVVNQAKRHGVGVVTFAKPKDLHTYEIKVLAEGRQPDLDLRDEFLSLLVGVEGIERLQTWLGKR